MRSFENQNYDVDVVSRSPLMLRVPVFCGVNFVSSSRISLSLCTYFAKHIVRRCATVGAGGQGFPAKVRTCIRAREFEFSSCNRVCIRALMLFE